MAMQVPGEERMKITMTLTSQDIENVTEICALPAVRSKSHAVSTALSLTRFLIDEFRSPGTQLMLRTADGSFERIYMPELHIPARQRSTAHPVVESA